jgi:hypothetical protein
MHQPHGITTIEAPWPELARAAKAKCLSHGRTIALIVGLSALLWELVFGAVRWLVTF